MKIHKISNNAAVKNIRRWESELMKQHVRLIGLFFALAVLAPVATTDAALQYRILRHEFTGATKPGESFFDDPIPIDVVLVGGTIELAFDDFDFSTPKDVKDENIVSYSIKVVVDGNVYEWTDKNGGASVDLTGDISLQATSSALAFVPGVDDDPDDAGSLELFWSDGTAPNAPREPEFKWSASAGFRNYEVDGVEPPGVFNFHADTFEDFSPPNVFTIATVVPEPGSMAVFGGLALIGLAGATWKRRKVSSSVV